MALTNKKRAFVDAIEQGASNRDAAIAAGYSPATASAAGSRLAKDPLVKAELERRSFNKSPAPTADAGESPKPAPEEARFDVQAALMYRDPKAFLLAVMNDSETEAKLRVEAAKTLMPFVHPKKGEGGKKDEKDAAAKAAASGRFGQGAQPSKVVPIKR